MPFASSISSDLCFSPVYMWWMSTCPSCDDVDRNPCAGLCSMPWVDHVLFSFTLLGAGAGVGGWIGLLLRCSFVCRFLTLPFVLSCCLFFRLLFVLLHGVS